MINKMWLNSKVTVIAAIVIIIITFSGTGESGKSTFIKQMRIIHGKGYSEADRLQFKNLVFQNMHKAIISLVQAMDTLGIDYEDSKLETEVEDLVQVKTETIEDFSEEHKTLIIRIWSDEAVHRCYERRREYQLSDSAK